MSYGWILGYISLPGLAYLLKDFRYLQAIPTVSATVFLITWLWTIPESPRWQLSNNKLESGHKSIVKAARANGKSISETEIYDKLSQLIADTETVKLINIDHTNH